jgi:hypothetical protein
MSWPLSPLSLSQNKKPVIKFYMCVAKTSVLKSRCYMIPKKAQNTIACLPANNIIPKTFDDFFCALQKDDRGFDVLRAVRLDHGGMGIYTLPFSYFLSSSHPYTPLL